LNIPFTSPSIHETKHPDQNKGKEAQLSRKKNKVEELQVTSLCPDKRFVYELMFETVPINIQTGYFKILPY
jgi:hypothetical protein